MKKPTEPEPGDCCGTGCARCVWDIYFDKLAEWEHARTTTTATSGCAEGESVMKHSRQEDGEDCDAGPVCRVGSVVVKYVEDEASTCAKAATWHPLGPHGEVEQHLQRVEKVLIHPDDAEIVGGGIFRVFLTTRSKPMNELCYRCGDTIDLFVSNETDLVDRLCRRLQLVPDRCCILSASPFVPAKNFPPWLPLNSPMTVRHLLKHYVDLTSSAYLHGPSFFSMIKKAAKSAVDVEGLGDLSVEPVSAASREVRRSLIARNWTMVDVLNAYPSASPSLARLLECTTPLKPRPFSVVGMTTAAVAAPNGSVEDMDTQSTSATFELCLRHSLLPRAGGPVVIEEDVTGEKREDRNNSIARWGHVSGPLRCGRSPEYLSTSRFGKSCVAGPFGGPLLLIGGGTGIAPLVSLMRTKRGGISGCGIKSANWIIYGVRHLREAVYHGELHAVADRYAVAVSRGYEDLMNPQSGRLIPDRTAASSSWCRQGHVTDILQEWAVDVASFVGDRGATIVSCGPAAMIQSVRNCLPGVLFAGKSDAEAQVRRLELDGRVIYDTWH